MNTLRQNISLSILSTLGAEEVSSFEDIRQDPQVLIDGVSLKETNVIPYSENRLKSGRYVRDNLKKFFQHIALKIYS